MVRLSGEPYETREQVLERLFREHSSALRGFLSVRMGVRQDELEDLVQDVFARLARMEDLLEKFPRENHQSRTYLFAIANNLAIDMERRKGVRRRYRVQEEQQAKSDEAPVSRSPEIEVLARQELGLVTEVLLGLKPEWRQAFILHRIMQKSHREVSQEMGISLRATERYIGKAIVSIKDALLEIRGKSHE